ncbi:MAG: gliding motility-associated ABC transporter substrate-binding protein GldG [Bacteroidales bacterium]|nr:gliding motility-associated ABC transporter substrate-binding protein GldG [Bacteroidales bacterium]
MKFLNKNTTIIIGSIIVLVVLSGLFHFRIDLTSDKRHSISRQTKELMKSIDEPIDAVIYLTGDLNSGFLRLKNSATEMLTELNAFSKSNINIRFHNPSEAESAKLREQKYLELEKRGIIGTTVYDKDKEGKAIQKIVFPWVELSQSGKTIAVNLLKNDPALSGEENLNISIENLEFELTDAVRRLVKKDVEKIAFLEGHGELGELETYEISKSLSHYFQIDRGVIGTDASVLDEYKAVIIAKPTEQFSEKDKFVLDQYVMNGGSLLWLIDGVRISEENLAQSGVSAVMPLDLNLGDLLFRYGIRINPVLVEDVQSTLMPVNIAPKGEKPQFHPVPWVFAPILLTSREHNATKNTPPVKARFASMVEPVGTDKSIEKTVILATSSNTHITPTPASISLAFMPDLKDKNYFNLAHVPVGAVLEGSFPSAFANRMVPPEIQPAPQIIKSSKKTRQIVFADGDIIRNEVVQHTDSLQTLPLGFDRYTNRQFGNNELITNAILYITDKDGWMKLRSRTIPLRLLNKSKATEQRIKWQIINVLLPLILLSILGVVYQFHRKRKYTSGKL